MINIKQIMLLYLGKLICKIETLCKLAKTEYKTRGCGVQIGMNSVISADTVLIYPHNISIGANSYINGGMLIASEKGKILIGDNCLISYNVHIRTDQHNYKQRNILIREQGHNQQDIIIGNDVWIGYGVQIMSGINISDGVVIGAAAVVTKDLEAYKVYAGVPAKQIGERSH